MPKVIQSANTCAQTIHKPLRALNPLCSKRRTRKLRDSPAGLAVSPAHIQTSPAQIVPYNASTVLSTSTLSLCSTFLEIIMISMSLSHMSVSSSAPNHLAACHKVSPPWHFELFSSPIVSSIPTHDSHWPARCQHPCVCCVSASLFSLGVRSWPSRDPAASDKPRPPVATVITISSETLTVTAAVDPVTVPST